MGEKVLKICKEMNCVKITRGGRCIAFTDPGYQWRKGSCYGYSNDKRILAGFEYDGLRGNLLCCKDESEYFIRFGVNRDEKVV